MRLKRHKSFGEINATLPERCSLWKVFCIIAEVRSQNSYQTLIINFRNYPLKLFLTPKI